MDRIVEKIINKIEEYNIGLLVEYKVEDGHCFITPGMIVFSFNKNNNLAIAFQADQKPEDVATNLLCLQEIKEIQEIKIMESFIHDMDKNYISGQAAHDLLKKDLIIHASKELEKRQLYLEILNTENCYEC